MGIHVKDKLGPEQLKLIESGQGFKYYFVTNDDYDHMGFEGTREECVNYCIKNQEKYPDLSVEAFVKL